MLKILEKVELWYDEFLIFQNSLTKSVWKKYHMFGGRENDPFKIGETVVSHNHYSSSSYWLQSSNAKFSMRVYSFKYIYCHWLKHHLEWLSSSSYLYGVGSHIHALWFIESLMCEIVYEHVICAKWLHFLYSNLEELRYLIFKIW